MLGVVSLVMSTNLVYYSERMLLMPAEGTPKAHQLHPSRILHLLQDRSASVLVRCEMTIVAAITVARVRSESKCKYAAGVCKNV